MKGKEGQVTNVSPRDEVRKSRMYYDKALKFLDTDVSDSSFFYFELAKGEFLAEKDSTMAATCLVQMAITLFYEGDYYGSQETSIEADKLLDKTDTAHHNLMAMNYNCLGNAISGYGNHNEAIQYYDLAIQYSRDANNSATYLNNKAVTYYYDKQYQQAYTIYEEVLKNTADGTLDYARALSNYANTRWHIDKKYNPLPDLHKALSIRRANNNLWGVSASVSHLYNFHKNRHPDSARFYAKMSYELADKLGNPNDKINALDRLIRVGKTDSLKYYFSMYTALTDSIRVARLKASNQFAMIRYEVEKSKKENAILQNAVLDRDLKMAKQRALVVGMTVLGICTMAFFLYWNDKKKKQLRLEAENLIKENKLKTSKKVHDVVANGIYRVMSEIEYGEELDREDLLDKLEVLYEKSRDISYEQEEEEQGEEEVSFAQEIAALIKSFGRDNLKILIVGNDDVWSFVKPVIKKELFPIIQELMVNMNKHSGATEVILKFQIEEGQLSLSYSDNGVGLPHDMKKGNGWINTGNRINNLNGQVIFGKEPKRGTHIQVIIPLN